MQEKHVVGSTELCEEHSFGDLLIYLSQTIFVVEIKKFIEIS